MELLMCYNKGCGQKFDHMKNEQGSCLYHPGVPVFHDAMKGWSCCKKRSTDFTEFLNFPGCSSGHHSNEKPKEAEKAKAEEIVIPEEKKKEPKLQFQQQRAPTQERVRPSVDEPRQKLKITVTPSLQKVLDKRMQEMSLESNEAEGSSSAVKVGTSCTNNGCKSAYKSAESDIESCTFHPGVAIFHEGMKYWSCCNRKTSDFTNFLDQAGCEKGKHVWIKKETADTKKSCRFDWFQTSPNVTISVFSKVAVPDQCWVEVNQITCNIHIVFEGGKSLFEKSIVLRDAILPEKSEVKMMGTKVEIVLKKAESFSWPALEHVQEKENNSQENGEKAES